MKDTRKAPEFPPWAVSAYGIAVRHGFLGTEREFMISLLGRPGAECLPMILVTAEDEEDVPEDRDLIMRPSSDAYAYETERNEFRAADRDVYVPDGFSLDGDELMLACGGEAFGEGVELPSADLPEVSAADNGKALKVVSGEWAPGTL